jgi:hypothetical protein
MHLEANKPSIKVHNAFQALGVDDEDDEENYDNEFPLMSMEELEKAAPRRPVVSRWTREKRFKNKKNKAKQEHNIYTMNKERRAEDDFENEMQGIENCVNEEPGDARQRAWTSAEALA